MTNTMTPGVSLVFLFFGIFLLTVKGQPASQSGKNGGKATNIIPTKSCTCVPYYLCDKINGKSVTDIRKNNDHCSNYLELCCDKENLRDEPITPPPIKTSGCGRRHADGVDSRITHNDNKTAQYGEFPWTVAVLKRVSVEPYPTKLNMYQCGGALIHPQFVVTAAHCVSDNNNNVFKIRAGEWDTQQTDEFFPSQDRDVQTIIVHPQYHARTLQNDIALLYLKSPVDIADNVDTICLPLQDTIINFATCYATGWGKDAFDKKGKYQEVLKKIDLPLVSNNECEEQLRTSTIGKLFELHKSFVCAGGVSGKYTCTGDDGSPLVCPIPGQDERYYQVGIVAWHSKCGEDNLPGVFVNLPLFRDWIDSQMKSLGLDVTSYQY